MTDCIFCRIAEGEVAADIAAADGEFVAFADAHPVAPVHLLVVPRQHVASLAEVDALAPDAAGRMLRFIAAAAEQAGLAANGYRVITNSGPDAGQQVHHLHWHVVGGARLGRMA
jgi:histidine triad (HIT) family protein